MNIFLWILQLLFALHTAIGGVWKFSNPTQSAVPSLSVIPNGLWLTLGILELAAAVALILPVFNKSWSILIPLAALFVVGEMLLYCVLHLSSGNKFNGQVVYWLVVAVIGAFIAYSRFVKPL